MAYKRKKGKSIVKGRKKKSYTYKGVKYKSGLERNMAICLDEQGIEFEYEPETFEVMKGFKFNFDCFERQRNGKGDMINRGKKKILPIKYTPDFIGDGFIIETKGYANEAFPNVWKLFKQMLSEDPRFNPDDLVIYKPQKISECKQVAKHIKERHESRGKGAGDN